MNWKSTRIAGNMSNTWRWRSRIANERRRFGGPRRSTVMSVGKHRQGEQHIPLAKYCLYVGGVLLALLLVLNAYLPKLPIADMAHANLPDIHIHSDRKWPERIVFDTSRPAIIPAGIASSGAGIPLPETAGDGSGKARKSEALAQMQPSDAGPLQPPNPKKRKLKLQHKSRIARRYMPPHFTSARQWQFGWFGQSSWRGG